ncbi:hypothetical protein HRbin12_01036 [bacterium HR12]|nr:hypothetical protein HRbin12_01036 [bacterium HR12]GIV00634.1 MAG: hypothetical protein KatS3mg014_2249 [Actinomycetota bacterium]
MVANEPHDLGDWTEAPGRGYPGGDPISFGGDAMSMTVLPPDRLPVGPSNEDQYRLAVEEARAQAEALRHAVCRANDLVRQLEEMVEALRAILLYPKAYDWPPLEPSAEPSADADDLLVLPEERTAASA